MTTIFKFTIDPDDGTLEYLAGSSTFWHELNSKYTYNFDIEGLDNILSHLLFDNPFNPDFIHANNATYGDVINQDGNKLILSEDTFNTLRQLNERHQQVILSDIVYAFIDDYQNIMPNVKNYAK